MQKRKARGKAPAEGASRKVEAGRRPHGEGAQGAKKYVYFFGGGKADGDRTMKDLLGGKGSGLAEMTNAGLPVPPGFTISTAACNLYYDEGRKLPPAIDDEMMANLRKLEKVAGATVRLDRATRCSSRSARARSSRCPA